MNNGYATIITALIVGAVIMGALFFINNKKMESSRTSNPNERKYVSLLSTAVEVDGITYHLENPDDIEQARLVAVKPGSPGKEVWVRGISTLMKDPRDFIVKAELVPSLDPNNIFLGLAHHTSGSDDWVETYYQIDVKTGEIVKESPFAPTYQ